MGKPDEVSTAAEFGLLKAALTRRGLTMAQQDQAVGTAPQGRTRRQIAEQLRVWLKARPKG